MTSGKPRPGDSYEVVLFGDFPDYTPVRVTNTLVADNPAVLWALAADQWKRLTTEYHQVARDIVRHGTWLREHGPTSPHYERTAAALVQLRKDLAYTSNRLDRAVAEVRDLQARYPQDQLTPEPHK